MASFSYINNLTFLFYRYFDVVWNEGGKSGIFERYTVCIILEKIVVSA